MTAAAYPGPGEARIGGFAYLVTIIAGLFAEAFVRGRIPMGTDPGVTLAALRANEPLFRLGIGADLLMLASYVVVTAILYRLFRRDAPALSMVAAGFSALGIAVLASGTVLLLAALRFASAGHAEAVQFALRLHGTAYGVSLVFFGLYCGLLAAMILRTRLLPAPVGWLLALAGAAFLVKNVAGIVLPEFVRQVPPVTMLTSLIGEGALGLWLAVFGVRRGRAEIADRDA